MSKLSALIVVHNEQENLPSCLERLKFVDELVVVLDKCDDASEEIARRFTDRIFKGSWDIEGERRNYGLEQCQGEWILEVDADERVPEALAEEIRAVTMKGEHDLYIIPVDNYIGGKLVRYGWGGYIGKSGCLGLFRKGCKEWGMQTVHPKLTFKGSTGPCLQNRLQHYVDRDISDLLHRLDRYTEAQAVNLRHEMPKNETLGRNIRRIFSRFLKCYVVRKGYREGKYGLLIAICAGLYPLVSYLKATLEKK